MNFKEDYCKPSTYMNSNIKNFVKLSREDVETRTSIDRSIFCGT